MSSNYTELVDRAQSPNILRSGDTVTADGVEMQVIKPIHVSHNSEIVVVSPRDLQECVRAHLPAIFLLKINCRSRTTENAKAYFSREITSAQQVSRAAPWATPWVIPVTECRLINMCGFYRRIEVDDCLGEGMLLEYHDAPTLFDHTRNVMWRGPESPHGLSYEETLVTAYTLACELKAVHDVGIVHRDIKPSNVILTRSGAGVQLIDFGLATKEGCDDIAPKGEACGTPGYLAPECLLGNPSQAATVAADLFSFGSLIDEVHMRGANPRAKDLWQYQNFLHQHKTQKGKMSFPQELRASPLIPVIEKLMAYEPEKRYSSADELIKVLGDQINAVLSGNIRFLPPQTKEPPVSTLRRVTSTVCELIGSAFLP